MQLAATKNIKETPMLHKTSTGSDGSVRPGSSHYRRMDYKDLDHVIDTMKDLHYRFKAHPKIRQKAFEITKGIKKDSRTGIANRRDFHALADAVYKWGNRNIAYMRDPDGVEYVQSPLKTLKYGFGDCDDHTVLYSTLLSSIGVPVRFKLAKANPNNKNAYSHIYFEYETEKGEWLPFDTTLHTKAGHGLADFQIYGSKVIPLQNSVKKKSSPCHN